MEKEKEEYDELKAYKIISKYYEDAKIDLYRLEDEFNNNKILIEEKKNQLKISNSYEDDYKVFSPKYKDIDQKEIVNDSKKEIENLENNNKFIYSRIISTREKVAEFSFVLNLLKKISRENNESEYKKDLSGSIRNSDIIINKLNMCKSLIDLDRNRVRYEINDIINLMKNNE